jgi:hypothetical protein
VLDLEGEREEGMSTGFHGAWIDEDTQKVVKSAGSSPKTTTLAKDNERRVERRPRAYTERACTKQASKCDSDSAYSAEGKARYKGVCNANEKDARAKALGAK